MSMRPALDTIQTRVLYNRFVAMKRLRLLIPVALVLALAAAAWSRYAPETLVLTGIVTTHDVIVSPQVAGQVADILVKEGDAVRRGETLASLVTDELKADSAYYAGNAQGMAQQVRESQAALRYEQSQMEAKVAQAQATLAATEAQVVAARADLDVAAATLARVEDLSKNRVAAPQSLDEARASSRAAQARLDALRQQADAQRAALALAKSNADQVSLRRSAVQAATALEQAASAQQTKAGVRLGYAEIKAPIDGVVDVRAARAGEYLTAGAPLLTLVNPDDLWVRADIEETYIDRARVGDTLTVRLPSGEERKGEVIYRGVDAAYATQRDVSRTKRDIKTFEIRLRVKNDDRRLALGMTAYVVLPVR